MREFFARLDEKHIVGKLWENFGIFWWKFYRKLNFFLFLFYFFENLLLKIELSEITPFLHNILSVSGGGFPPPLPPWLRPCSDLTNKGKTNGTKGQHKNQQPRKETALFWNIGLKEKSITDNFSCNRILNPRLQE